MSTISLLSNLPQTSIYRQATESITKHRLQIVEKAQQGGDDVKAVEEGLGGMVESIIEEAKAEQGLVGKIIEWKG